MYMCIYVYMYICIYVYMYIWLPVVVTMCLVSQDPQFTIRSVGHPAFKKIKIMARLSLAFFVDHQKCIRKKNQKKCKHARPTVPLFNLLSHQKDVPAWSQANSGRLVAV